MLNTLDKEINKLSASSSWRGRSSGSTLINSFQFMLGGILNSFAVFQLLQDRWILASSRKMALQCLRSHSTSGCWQSYGSWTAEQIHGQTATMRMSPPGTAYPIMYTLKLLAFLLKRSPNPQVFSSQSPISNDDTNSQHVWSLKTSPDSEKGREDFCLSVQRKTELEDVCEEPSWIKKAEALRRRGQKDGRLDTVPRD